MERHAKILRRDAKAPFCLSPLSRWRFEHSFRVVLKKFFPSDSEYLLKGVDILTAHHAYSQDFVMAVDSLIIAEDPVSPCLVLGTFVRLLDICRFLLQLKEEETILELMREELVQKIQTDKAALPEFCWEKGAAELFFRKIAEAGIDRNIVGEDFFVHIDDVYDDCARTVQLGLWIMVSKRRAAVIDSWIFESAYSFFHHTLKKHIEGPKGLISILPKIIGSLKLGS